jgi:hypothetical protein
MIEFVNTPWKLWNELQRRLILPIVWLNFTLNNVSWRPGWRFYGTPIIQRHRLSRMEFGPGLQLRSSVRSNPLGPNHPVILCTWKAGAEMLVGENFSMTGGSLCAAVQIVIGNNVAVGANTMIVDTDFHPLDPACRSLSPQEGKSAPITIMDNVFIGMNSIILKGVCLGTGCVIGAGSVVTRDVPAGMIAAGNPARVIGPVKKECD